MHQIAFLTFWRFLSLPRYAISFYVFTFFCNPIEIKNKQTSILKLRHYEKATKIEKISHLLWHNSCFLLSSLEKVGDFFKFVWPTQKSWTLKRKNLKKAAFEGFVSSLINLAEIVCEINWKITQWNAENHTYVRNFA